MIIRFKVRLRQIQIEEIKDEELLILRKLKRCKLTIIDDEDDNVPNDNIVERIYNDAIVIENINSIVIENNNVMLLYLKIIFTVVIKLN